MIHGIILISKVPHQYGGSCKKARETVRLDGFPLFVFSPLWTLNGGYFMDENKTTQNINPGENGEKTFTQEQVNAIIGERLAKEKNKADAALAEKEQALKEREARLSCQEFLSKEGYPMELLDILNPSDFETFRNIVQRLDDLTGTLSKNRELPHFTKSLGSSSTVDPLDAKLRNAFKPKI